MKAFMENSKDTLSRLKADADLGLNDAQVEESRKEYGENKFTEEKPISILQRILERILQRILQHILQCILQRDARFVKGYLSYILAFTLRFAVNRGDNRLIEGFFVHRIRIKVYPVILFLRQKIVRRNFRRRDERRKRSSSAGCKKHYLTSACGERRCRDEVVAGRIQR